MFDQILTFFFGSQNERDLKALKPQLEAVLAKDEWASSLKDEDFPLCVRFTINASDTIIALVKSAQHHCWQRWRNLLVKENANLELRPTMRDRTDCSMYSPDL